MIAYARYLRTLTRHRWFVFVECCKAGIPVAGLLHDLSKYLPSEFIAYTRYFEGSQQNQDGFDFAWLLHQKRNRHHWQFWMLPEDDGGTKLLPMSPRARLEMLCDWKGAGRTYGSVTSEWYAANSHRMQLHPDTRAWIETQLDAKPVRP